MGLFLKNLSGGEIMSRCTHSGKDQVMIYYNKFLKTLFDDYELLIIKNIMNEKKHLNVYVKDKETTLDKMNKVELNVQSDLKELHKLKLDIELQTKELTNQKKQLMRDRVKLMNDRLTLDRMMTDHEAKVAIHRAQVLEDKSLIEAERLKLLIKTTQNDRDAVIDKITYSE
jgi:hypothetical protein